MKVDYHLRNGIIGRLGSFWARQVDASTRGKATELSRTAGLSGRLSAVDAAAAYCAAEREVTVFDTTFNFTDGVFATVGQDLQAFDHVAMGADVTTLRDPARPGLVDSSAARPHALAGGLQAPSGIALPLGTDWFILPVPSGMFPLLISTRTPGIKLVRGMDFFAYEGFIALRANPADVFDAGVVHVPVAQVRNQMPNAFPLRGDLARSSNRWLAEYQKQSHGAPCFRRAAAEYCGMWVLTQDDVVLGIRASGDATTYLMAAAGPRVVDYPHQPLQIGTSYPAGTVVGPLFRVGPPQWGEVAGDIITAEAVSYQLPGAYGAVFSLDGILPVKGITWDTSTSVRVSSSGAAAVVGSTATAVEWHFGGDPAALARFNNAQRYHELGTTHFLSQELGDVNGFTGYKYVDFSAILSEYYGDRLLVCVFGAMPDTMRVALDEFLNACKPSGCVLLVAHNYATI